MDTEEVTFYGGLNSEQSQVKTIHIGEHCRE